MNSKNQNTLPKHIAIIMDGNGRWAKSKNKARIFGHQKGVKTVNEIVKQSLDLDIKILTLYAFSSENWLRPATEVSWLMHLFLSILKKDAKSLKENNIKLNIIGDKNKLNTSLIKKINEVERLTCDNFKLQLNVAINYGGRWDILNATKKIAKQYKENQLEFAEINEDLFTKYLATQKQNEPDLLIRTGGDCRISNFLLWQLAYCELYFSDTLWPDFTKEEFKKIICTFATRERRFGKITKKEEA